MLSPTGFQELNRKIGRNEESEWEVKGIFQRVGDLQVLPTSRNPHPPDHKRDPPRAQRLGDELQEPLGETDQPGEGGAAASRAGKGMMISG